MNFRNFGSDNNLIDRISQSILMGNISHAYIIEGDLTTDKLSFAMAFSKAILCKNDLGYGCDTCINCRKLDNGNYEDFHLVEATYGQGRTVKSIKDEDIEELQRVLKQKPNNERHIAIISDADTMTLKAQNRLLKTLEEPSIGTVIILLSENSDNLLETVRSRAIKYHIYGNIKEDSDLVFEKEVLDMVFSGADFYTLKEKLGEISKREDAFTFLDNLEKVCRNILLTGEISFSSKRKERIFKVIYLIEDARKDLVNKCNYGYVLKNLILKI